jgi:transposase
VNKTLKAIQGYGLTLKAISKAISVSYMTVLRWHKGYAISKYNQSKLETLLNALTDKGVEIKPHELSSYTTRQLVNELQARGWIVTINLTKTN